MDKENEEMEALRLQDEINHSYPQCEEPMQLHSIDPVNDTICYYCAHCKQHWQRQLGC